MLKGTKCDWCEEVIEHYGYRLSFHGLDYYFDCKECMDEFIEDIVVEEDVEEPEDYDV